MLPLIPDTTKALRLRLIRFHKDESGKPIWKDTYVYAVTEGDWARYKRG